MKFSLNFIIREDRPNSLGLCPIYLRYTCQRKFTNIPLHETILPIQWNKEGNTPKSNHNDYFNLINKMNDLYSKCVKIIGDYHEKNKQYPRTDILKDILENKNKQEIIEENKMSIYNLFQDYIQYGKRNNLKKSTTDIYTFTLNKWMEFDSKNKFTLNDMNLKTLDEFRLFLNDKGLLENSVGKYVKTMKSFLNYCSNNLELQVPSSYKKVKVANDISNEIVYLTKEELEVLKRECFFSGFMDESKFKLNEQEKLIGQIMIFLCSTGLSYVDFSNITINHIDIEEETIEGKMERFLTLKISRQKLNTIIPCRIPIIDVTVDLLLDKLGIDRQLYEHDGIPLPIESKIKIVDVWLKKIKKTGRSPYFPKLFPNVSLQHFNREIKSIMKKIEIDSDVCIRKKQNNQVTEIFTPKYNVISSHTGRRTYVTLSLEAGIQYHLLMETTGHRKTQTLARYNKTSDKSLFREFRDKITNRKN